MLRLELTCFKLICILDRCRRLQAAQYRFGSSEQRLWRDLRNLTVVHPRYSSNLWDHVRFNRRASGHVHLDAASDDQQDAGGPVGRCQASHSLS
jgi:hypothetical protein